MLALTEKDIRLSLINASLRERNQLTLPQELPGLAWDKLDYLGWRDIKSPGIGYVITWLADRPVGIMLRQAEGRLRTRPQCSWSEDIQLPNDVVFFSVKRAGQAGRNGNTIATLVCAGFECSENVRRRPSASYVGFDIEAARQRRIDVLRERVQNFVRGVRDGG